MIASVIRQICLLSILCGVSMSLAPEGTVKRILSIACSVALVSAVLQPLVGLDFTAYALEIAKNNERRAEFLENNADLNERLNRLVIQAECQTYILDKAEELGTELRRVTVLARWSSEGLWVPYSVELDGTDSAPERRKLGAVIEAELGIPEERQQWSS